VQIENRQSKIENSLLQFHRQRDRELRTFADFACHDDLSAHQVDEFFNNGEAETGAAVFARARHVCLAKFIEDVFQRLLIHADAGVGHGELDCSVIARGGDFDLAFFGKFDGVAQ
jgi:hypothetical protein